jgi:hypothetical protein
VILVNGLGLPRLGALEIVRLHSMMCKYFQYPVTIAGTHKVVSLLKTLLTHGLVDLVLRLWQFVDIEQMQSGFTLVVKRNILYLVLMITIVSKLCDAMAHAMAFNESPE